MVDLSDDRYSICSVVVVANTIHSSISNEQDTQSWAGIATRGSVDFLGTPRNAGLKPSASAISHTTRTPCCNLVMVNAIPLLRWASCRLHSSRYVPASTVSTCRQYHCSFSSFLWGPLVSMGARSDIASILYHKEGTKHRN